MDEEWFWVRNKFWVRNDLGEEEWLWVRIKEERFWVRKNDFW